VYESLKENLVVIIVIALLLTPVLINAIKKNLFRQFSFPIFIKALNGAFVVQLIMGMIVWVVLLIINKYGGTYEFGNGNYSRDLFIGAFLVYSVIMLTYTPALIILNITNLAIGKFKKNKLKSTNSL